MNPYLFTNKINLKSVTLGSNNGEYYRTLIKSLSSGELNSSMLDYIAYFNLQDHYYLIVQFTSSDKQYIYCKIHTDDWNSFSNNVDNSYGKSFHKYLKKYGCNCKH